MKDRLLQHTQGAGHKNAKILTHLTLVSGFPWKEESLAAVTSGTRLLLQRALQTQASPPSVCTRACVLVHAYVLVRACLCASILVCYHACVLARLCATMPVC